MDPIESKAMLAASMEQERESGDLVAVPPLGDDAGTHKVTLERDSNRALEEDFQRRVRFHSARMRARAPSERLDPPPYREGAPVWTDLHLAVGRRVTRDEVRSMADSGQLPGFRVLEAEEYFFLRRDVEDWATRSGPARPKPPHDGLYRVYVIDLPLCDKAAHTDVRCVYVGQSWYGPTERFLQHLVGYNSRPHVHNWGTCLLPEFTEHLVPTESGRASEVQEQELAQCLRGAGFSVHGGT